MSPSRARRYVLRSRMFLIFLISGSLISMTVSTGVIAQQPNTPLAAVSNEAKQYPVGSRLRLEYDFPAQPLNLPTGPSSANSCNKRTSCGHTGPGGSSRRIRAAAWADDNHRYTESVGECVCKDPGRDWSGCQFVGIDGEVHYPPADRLPGHPAVEGQRLHHGRRRRQSPAGRAQTRTASQRRCDHSQRFGARRRCCGPASGRAGFHRARSAEDQSSAGDLGGRPAGRAPLVDLQP